jgi:hypothetical protein
LAAPEIERQGAGDAPVVVPRHIDQHLVFANGTAGPVHLMEHDLGYADALVERAEDAELGAAAAAHHEIVAGAAPLPQQAVGFQVVDPVQCLVDEDARQLLVVDVGAASHGVAEKDVGAVVRHLAGNDVVTASRHARVRRPHGTLGKKRHIGAVGARLDGGAQAGAAGTGDQHVGALDPKLRQVGHQACSTSHLPPVRAPKPHR